MQKSKDAISKGQNKESNPAKLLNSMYGKYDRETLEPKFHEGYHHKFTIILPISEEVLDKPETLKRVFTDDDLEGLKILFKRYFGGSTYPEETQHPLIAGQWENPKTGETIVNKHVSLSVYSKRNIKSIEFFNELKEILHDIAQKRRAKQEEIVIEQSEVTFINPTPLMLSLLRKTKRLDKTVKKLRAK